jgi:WD40 repeat protein
MNRGVHSADDETMLYATGFIYDWNLEEVDLPWTRVICRKKYTGIGRVPPFLLCNNSRFIASVTPEFYIKIWDLQAQRTYALFMEHAGWISSFAFTLDCSVLMSGSYDKSVFLWDLNEKKKITKFEVACYVFSVCVDVKGKNFVAGLSDGTIHIWKKANEEYFERVVSAHKSHIIAISFTENNDIVSIGNDSVVTLWEKKELEMKKKFGTTRFKIFQVAVYRNGAMLVLACGDKTFRVFKTNIN